jgi:uncharacterized protein YggE
MDRYIEVFGEGRYRETAATFIAAVILEVRAAKDETAFREVSELVSEGLAILRDAGIRDEEIVEGGTDLRRPWYWKKQVGQNASRKIILKVADFARLNRALELLEPLQSRHKERRTISIDMRQPEFAESVEAKSQALADAYEDAKAKASQLATTMGYRLGQPLYVEEGGTAKRNSGFSGDEDWGGDSSRFGPARVDLIMAAAGAAAEPQVDPQPPTRTIYVKCRVRFAIEHSQPK